uniref:NADH dehydrogenase subunit 4L n=1 Tax=Diversibipalium mayottensis TaxID=3348909 RepID=A0A8K1XU66_9PLAT|nr:NADH dehydrogenase subunit 4L [Diversibipalium sp. MNHN JL281]
MGHFFLLYWFSFRFLKFLVSVEVSLVNAFFCYVYLVPYKEVSNMLLFLTVAACGASLGLSVLVLWFRYSGKNSVMA